MKFIRFTFWRAKREATASPQFRAALWQRLKAQMNQAHVKAPVWYRSHQFRTALVSVVSLLMCASGATGVYAYTSPDVAAGTPLYPVKQNLESVEEALQVTPEQKAAFYLKQINRRESEEAVLRKQNKSTAATENAIKTVEKKLQVVSEKLDTTPGEDPTLRARVHAKLHQKQINLEQRQNNLEQKLAAKGKE